MSLVLTCEFRHHDLPHFFLFFALGVVFRDFRFHRVPIRSLHRQSLANAVFEIFTLFLARLHFLENCERDGDYFITSGFVVILLVVALLTND